MPKRILSIICLTNAMCEHQGLLFKLISTHIFDSHSANIYLCLLWVTHSAGHYCCDVFELREFLKSNNTQEAEKNSSFEYKKWSSSENLNLLPSNKDFFYVILHTYSSLGKYLKITSKAGWLGMLAFDSLSVTAVLMPCCFFCILTFYHFLFLAYMYSRISF